MLQKDLSNELFQWWILAYNEGNTPIYVYSVGIHLYLSFILVLDVNKNMFKQYWYVIIKPSYDKLLPVSI